MRIRNPPQMNGQENTGFMKIKRRRKPMGFDPDSSYISQAIAEYLSRGGMINRVETRMDSLGFTPAEFSRRMEELPQTFNNWRKR